MVARLRDAILRGDRASQPAAGDVDVGTVYYVTDESVTERSNGTTWDDISDGGAGGGAPTDATYLTTAAHGSLSDEVVVTAPATGGAVPKIVVKTADEIVNNSAVLQNDDHLLLALAVNELWVFEFSLFYDSGTTPDIKFALTIPAGATINRTASGNDAGGSIRNDSTTFTASGDVSSHDGQNVGVIRHTSLRGWVKCGATPGNLQLQWAQNTANGSDTTLHANSYLMAWKVA